MPLERTLSSMEQIAEILRRVDPTYSPPEKKANTGDKERDTITDILNRNSQESLLNIQRQNGFLNSAYQQPNARQAVTQSSRTYGGAPMNGAEMLADMKTQNSQLPSGLRGDSKMADLQGTYNARMGVRQRETEMQNQGAQFNVAQQNQAQQGAQAGRIAQAGMGMDALNANNQIKQRQSEQVGQLADSELNRRTQIGLKLQEMGAKAAEMGEARYKIMTETLGGYFKDDPQALADASIALNKIIRERGVPKDTNQAMEYANEAATMMKQGYQPDERDVALAQDSVAQHGAAVEKGQKSNRTNKVTESLSGASEDVVTTPGGRKLRVSPQRQSIIDNDEAKRILEAKIKQGELDRQGITTQKDMLGMEKDRLDMAKTRQELAQGPKPTPAQEAIAKKQAVDAVKTAGDAPQALEDMQNRYKDLKTMYDIVDKGKISTGKLQGPIGTAGQYVGLGSDSEQYDMLAAGMELSSAAEFLRGQGSITDGERKILKATVPTRGVSEKVIKDELMKRMKIIERGYKKLEEKQTKANQFIKAGGSSLPSGWSVTVE